jgi:pimeloyl-ACP methyl ester carboxylesterase
MDGNELTFEQVPVNGIRTEVLRGGKGPPLLYLHGPHGVDPDRAGLAVLAGAFTVIAPSLPGFGGSDLPAGLSSIDELSYFCLDLIKALGLGTVAVAGASIGGWVAAELSIKTTAPVGKLVLLDAVGMKPETPDTLADVFGLSEAQVVERSYHNPAAFQPRFPQMADADLTRIARNRESLALYTWSPYMHDPKLKRWLHRIDVPTLVLWGESDRIAPVAYGRAYAAAIPGAMFETVPQAGHHPLREQPQAVAGRITRFLNGR